jgi:tetratricopeptide (TPR) repeat protein
MQTMPLSPSEVLVQLETYLTQDPGNESLRAEAFEVAMRGGLRDRAETHLTEGSRSGRDALAWGLRRAQWLMSVHSWDKARVLLESLRREATAPPALVACVLHDSAYVALRTGDFASGLEILQPCVEADVPSPAVQALWLRLLHRSDRLDEALRVAATWSRSGRLSPVAAGPAALVSMDCGDIESCKRWSEAALDVEPEQLEALVARASVALAEQSAEQARQLLQVALRQNPHDGRARSAMAFADLLDRRLVDARAQFELALQSMPEHIGTWHGLAWTALLLDDNQQAGAAFEHALELDRNFAESHGGIAVVLARTGHRPEAAAAIERALRLDRHCMSAHYAQAVLDNKTQDARAMEALARRLLSLRTTAGARLAEDARRPNRD